MKKSKKIKSVIFVMSLAVILVVCTLVYVNIGGEEAPIPIEGGTAHNLRRKKTLQTHKEIAVDDPLLMLVNNENEIPPDYEAVPRLYGDVIVDVKIYDDLVRLIEDAAKDGMTLWIASGYRTVDVQEKLYDVAVDDNVKLGMSNREAKTVASQTIALPGYSEHHTGLAVDFNTVSEDFENTPEYAWLQENAENYGFVKRYEAEKTEITGIEEEVWHYRYVGVKHAKQMNELDMCLEEYCKYLQNP